MGEIIGWLIASLCIILFVTFAVASTCLAVLSLRIPTDASRRVEGH
jgi:hypothetical protein